MSTLRSRQATADDAAQIAALVQRAYRGDESRVGWTTEADLLSDDRIDAREVTAKINEPTGAVLMFFDEADLLACCEVLHTQANDVYFGMFAVEPTRQGAGIGREVLAAAQQWALQQGAVSIRMQVIAQREELIAYYERRGFHRAEQTVPFFYDKIPAEHVHRDDLYFVVLSKDLL